MKKYILSALILVFGWSTAMAVTTVSVSICPSGCMYSSLASAVTGATTLDGAGGNLVSSNSTLDFNIQGTWYSPDTTAVAITSAYTTDATRGITIRTSGNARHDGTAYKSGAYSLFTASVGNYSAPRLDASGVNYVVVDGLVVKCTNSGQYNVVILGSQNGIVSNNIVYGSGNTNVAGIWFNSGSFIYNNIVYGFSSGYNNQYGGIMPNENYVSNASIYNNTTYKNFIGINLSLTNYASSTVINNIAIKNVNSDFNLTKDTFSVITQNNNVSSDGTATGTGSISLVSDTISFSNTVSGSEDFHLKSTAPAINTGTVVTLFSTDIIGTSRPQGSAWDIGAFEYISSAVATWGTRFANFTGKNFIYPGK